MDKETADLIIRLLQTLANHTQEYWVKLTALERALSHSPELKREYAEELRKLRDDPATSANHQGTVALLEMLRAKLLQD